MIKWCICGCEILVHTTVDGEETVTVFYDRTQQRVTKCPGCGVTWSSASDLEDLRPAHAPPESHGVPRQIKP